MWKALLAGFFALALSMPVQASAQFGSSPALESGIARFKAALRLTPEQERHWPRVEAALRTLARESDADAAQTGFFRRIGARATELALSADAIRRLVSAAQPLVKSLNPEQKREAVTLARAMGFGSLAARFE